MFNRPTLGGHINIVNFNTPSNGDMPITQVLDPENVTNTSATLKGKVVSAGTHTIVERGFFYVYEDFAGEEVDVEVSAGSGLGDYSYELTDLIPNTLYYYTTWVKIETDEVIYNDDDERSFQTDNTAPTVITQDMSSVTYTSAVANGKIISNTDPVLERGFCYSVNNNPMLTEQGEPTVYTIKVVVEGDSEVYSYTLTNLEEGTTYRLRAYALTSYGPIFGEKRVFTTPTFFMPQLTLNIGSVTASSAELRGHVYGIYDSDVQLRGFCYSTSPNVSLDVDGCMIVEAGSGVGEYSRNLTGLASGTTYYAKAFARVDENTVAYSEERSFTTVNDDPQVITYQADNVMDVSAMVYGNVMGETSQTVTERGFCYGTSPGQNIDNPGSTKIAVGSGMGQYSYSLSSLSTGTTYYVKAYAITNLGRTLYGDEISFTTVSIVGPEGTIGGLFSVSASKQVFFSKGNLQYQASSNTWRFAENQWDYIGYGNQSISSTNSGWIDLFGWGTSGFNHGAVCYQPWSTSTNYTDYYVYGDWHDNLEDETGMADWGRNPISNGGNVANLWYTLTVDEWYYVFYERVTSSGSRFVKGKVNGVCGMILLPDDWDNASYSFVGVNVNSCVYINNIISSSDWSMLQAKGAVFLPYTGSRYETSFYDYYESLAGLYWSSSRRTGESCYVVYFGNAFTEADHHIYRFYGNAVRLVQNR